MNIAFVVGGVAVILFLLAYFTRRRFGVLGLALAAGYVLSKLWQNEIPKWAQYLPLESGVIDPVTIITLFVILLPSVVLLLGGPSYRSKKGRVVGALLYGMLAVVFSLSAFETSRVLAGSGHVVFEALIQHQQYILTVALGVSVVDVLSARSRKGEKAGKKH